MSRNARSPRPVVAALASLAVLAGLTACGSDDGSTATGTDASSSSSGSGSDSSGSGGSEQAPVVVDITVKDGKVTPSGDRVKVKAGQPVDLKVDADGDGEIHVHSEPEQEFAYKEGEQTFALVIDRPGVITVEDHELDQIIVQLEVR